MNTKWGYLLILPFLISALLLVGSQFAFITQGFYVDLPFGQKAVEWSFGNFARVFTDSYYFGTLWLTTYISLIVAATCICVGFPVAKVLARMQSKWTTILLSTIVLTSFITMVIQIFGLIIIFRADGLVNRALLALGLVDRPFALVGTAGGVIIGLVYASFGFAVMLMYGVVRTIPVSLDEAAAIHGASRARILGRVVLPLCLPGLIVAFLTIFNTSMGAFTSAALLGGGRILTWPVLIQRTMLVDVNYGMASTLATMLLIFVVALNLASIAILRRLRSMRAVTV